MADLPLEALFTGEFHANPVPLSSLVPIVIHYTYVQNDWRGSRQGSPFSDEQANCHNQHQ